MENLRNGKMQKNPRQSANFLSTILFWWMLPVYKNAYKKYEVTDLPEPLNEDKSEKLIVKIEEAWNNERRKALNEHRVPSLLRVLIKIFGPKMALYSVLMAFLELVVKIIQPISLGYLVFAYSIARTEESIHQSYIHSGIIIACSFVTVLIYYPCATGLMHLSLKIRIACSSLLYRKSLRLKGVTQEENPAGKIINLISNDVNMDSVCFFCHNLWIGPIVVIITSYLMYQEIGWCALVGVLVVIVILPFQAWLTKIAKSRKLKAASETDSRLRLTNEIINGILTIKMYTWEIFFENSVTHARRKELKFIGCNEYIRSIHIGFLAFRTRMAIFASILAFAVTGNALSAQKVFLVTACFNTMKRTVTDLYTFAIEQVGFAKVSIGRMQQFLLKNEFFEFVPSEDKIEMESKGVKIVLRNVVAKWTDTAKEFTLQNINFEGKSGDFIVLVGPIGCGKSSFLNVILEEIQYLNDGCVTVSGKISYASQDPWLFNGTIQQNILFGLELDQNRYNNVIDICALQEDLENFQQKDQTIVGERGITLSGGQRLRINLARVLYRDADIYLFDDPFSAIDINLAKHMYGRIKQQLRDKLCIFTTNYYEFLDKHDHIIFIKHGQIVDTGIYGDIVERHKELTQITSGNKKDEDEKIEESVKTKQNTVDAKVNKQEKKCTGRVTWSVYFAYLRAFGNWFIVSGILSLIVLQQILASASDFYLGYWVTQQQIQEMKGEKSSTGCESCVYNYSILIGALVIVALGATFLFFKCSIKASLELHMNMFKGVLYSPMKFFHLTPPGWILNRFSKDITNIDGILQTALINSIGALLSIVGIIIVVAIVNPYSLIPVAVMFLILYKLRSVHLSVSNNLTRAERTSWNPVINLVASSMHGLTTIRAMNAQHILVKQFDQLQDVNTTAKYFIITATRMFAMWLEVLCSIYTTIVVCSFLFYSNEYGGNVGLAITQAMGMVGLVQWSIRQSAELENYMTSVELITEYVNLEPEHPESSICVIPPARWPQYGRIEFHNLSLHYENTAALRNVTFTIESKEKIGIIGRSGAGKSSIVNALLQLSAIKGNVIIDQINVSQLNLKHLRSRISVIPQEPFLFSGTIRTNIDPDNVLIDNELWKILEKVKLKEYVEKLDKNVLTNIVDGGRNLSVGQRQLICLARAIALKNQILILDEATANIDEHTDTLIQETIKNDFKSCTVIKIAHRLQNIMDCDKIMVIENGQVTEFDQPKVLLKNKESYLTMLLGDINDKT